MTKARFLQVCHLTPVLRAMHKQQLVPVENYMLHFSPLGTGLTISIRKEQKALIFKSLHSTFWVFVESTSFAFSNSKLTELKAN